MRQGTNTGSFGAHFTARDMARFGFLYLNGGQWDGTQVIPQDYVAASTRKQSDGGPPVNANYGYLWWIEQVRGFHAFFASGFGGKYIYVIPELDLVVVTTASTQQAQKDREQHNKIRALIPNFILPALIANGIPQDEFEDHMRLHKLATIHCSSLVRHLGLIENSEILQPAQVWNLV
jgi:CubicO group peptidase (beta-lactamase class C family)